MADLIIPEAAETALALGNTRYAIRVTVAAELRRLRDEITPRLTVIKTEADCAPSGAGEFAEGSARALDCIVDCLTSRADELCGGAV